MDNAVALASLALAGTVVGGLIWVLKYFAKTLSKDLQEHTAAAIAQRQASEEVLIFMKNLNGKLTKATVDTVKQKQPTP